MMWIIFGAGIVVTILLALVFGPWLLQKTYINLGYLLWRITGNLRSITEGQTLQQAYGLSQAHPMLVQIDKDFLISNEQFAREIEQSKEKIRFLEDLRLTPLADEHADNEYDFTIHFERIFSVNSKRIKRGCHGRYSLAKATYLGITYGGDPMCGGGIKAFSAPRWKNILEFMKLRRFVNRVLSGEKMRLFVQSYETCDAVVFHNEPTKGFATFLIGEEGIVREYARMNKFNIKPLELQLQFT